jgi:HEAT repeat protein
MKARIFVCLAVTALILAGAFVLSQRSGKDELNPIIDRLIHTLKYGQEIFEQPDAIIALGMIGDPRAIEPLMEYLANSPNELLRADIAKALGRIGDKRAAPLLISTMERDSYEHCRYEAAWALGEIGDKQAVSSLKKALKDKDEYVREQATEALEKIESRRERKKPTKQTDLNNVIGSLVKILQYGDPYSDKEDAIITLGMIGSEKGIEPLCEILKNAKRDHLRSEAAKALDRIGNKRATPALIQALLNDSYRHTRCGAAQALEKIGDKRAVPALKKALKDEYYHTRRHAAKALKKLTGKDYPYEGPKESPLKEVEEMMKKIKETEKGLPEQKQ